MDELERQLRGRRSELDGVEDFDREAIWSATAERLTGAATAKKRRLRRWWVGVAAAIVAALLLAPHLSRSSTGLTFGSRPRPDAPRVLQLADISQELGRKEAALRRSVHEKEVSLGLDRIDAGRYGMYLEELRVLDSLRTSYLAELPEYGTNERLVTSLIRLYELELRLLRQLETEITTEKKYDSHDPHRTI